MSESKPDTATGWVDPDDSPEWTDEMFATAEFAVGGKVIRPATGYLGPNGVVQGRPPLARARQAASDAPPGSGRD
jgi:hypothetical protein